MLFPIHPQILTIVNRIENELLQIMILHALDYIYNCMSCDSKIPVHAYKTILLKQKKMGEKYEPAGMPGQSLQTGTAQG
jgi:hypothetical protein